MTICIDTNVVLGMFGRSGPWLALRRALLHGQMEWAVSTDILLEYEEVAARELNEAAAHQLLRLLSLLEQTRGNIRRIHPTFSFHLITTDPDDDKFVDCAIVAEADYILTSDHHFAVMKGSGYKPQPITPADFIAQCLE